MYNTKRLLYKNTTVTCSTDITCVTLILMVEPYIRLFLQTRRRNNPYPYLDVVDKLFGLDRLKTEINIYD